MNEDELQAIFTGAYRKRRRDAKLLILVSSLFVVLTLTGVIVDAPGRSQILATIAAAVGFVFFGDGTVVLLVRFLRGR